LLLVASLLASGCGAEGSGDVSGEIGPLADAGAVDADPAWRHPLCERVAGLCQRPSTGRVGTPVVLAPSEMLPAEFESQTAHNNLDVVWHEGRLFVAIRTAPSHFASPDTVMYVISSEDLEGWRYEGQVALGTDVREPQLVSWGSRLWLYYAVLGDNPFEFEPQGVEVMEYTGPGAWSEARPAFGEGFIPWRFKSIDGVLHLIGYVGGENIYDNDAEGIETQWLVSEDGEHFDPRSGAEPTLRIGGGSETDFVIEQSGRLVAVARNEAGDDQGFGSHVCTAEPEAPTEWSCRADPRKYDSPLMLLYDDQPWLVARRNLSESGNYDLGDDEGTMRTRFLRYQLDYWTRPKRCALWRVDGDTREVAFEVDLPSRGDTCFPEAIELGEGLFMVFNYTSPLDGADLSWQVAQGGPTWVYWVVLDLS